MTPWPFGTIWNHILKAPFLRRERWWKGPTDGNGPRFKHGCSTRTRGPSFSGNGGACLYGFHEVIPGRYGFTYLRTRRDINFVCKLYIYIYIYIYLYPTRKDINGRLVKNGIVSITSEFGCLLIDDDLKTFHFHCCLTPSLRRERCWKGPTDGSGQGFKDGFSTRTRGPCFLRRGESSMGILHLYIYIYHYVYIYIYIYIPNKKKLAIL